MEKGCLEVAGFGQSFFMQFLVDSNSLKMVGDARDCSFA